MHLRHVLAGLALAGLIAAGDALAQQAAQPAAPAPAPAASPILTTPQREITKIAGEVYRFRNNNHFSVFAVTPAGVIATDPVNKDAAAWLKAEIATRFGKQIKYVIYSHDHADHISGGEVWADTATVVSHVNAKPVIIGEKRPTAVPQLTFTDNLAIELGGTVVELSYVGRNHSDNSIVMRFPAERILFAVDFIPVKSVAFRDFPDAYIGEWIEGLKRVEAMDFDVFAPGHGPLGALADIKAYRGYMEDLRGQVLKLAREGKSVDEAKQMVDLSKYKDWAGFAQMSQLNIEGMYKYVQLNRRGN
ncbi:MAG: MBL fold metallo-hydrolase [Alphaproteobacteria bacterium]|nr:MBL fold metallo-hydrolase [Alphaproteobacteria bacterium]